MKVYDYLFISFKDLCRRKGRSTLTIIGIIIGTLLIVTMIGLGLGLRGFMLTMVNSNSDVKSITIDHFKYRNRENNKDINVAKFEDNLFKKIDETTISNVKNIKGVTSLRASIGVLVNKFQFEDNEYNLSLPIVGMDLSSDIFSEEYLQSTIKEENSGVVSPIVSGRGLSKVGENEALIGEDILNGLGIKAEEIVGKNISIIIDKVNGTNIKPIKKDMKVVGVINKQIEDKKAMIISAQDAAEIKGFQMLQNNYFKNKGYDKIEISVDSTKNLNRVIKEIESLGYMYKSTVELAKDIDRNFKNISLVISAVGIVVLIVASIGIVNTMGMAVYERRRSIGVMKSVGASGFNVKGIFLIQSSAIGFIGGLIGLILAYGINGIIQIIINNYIQGSGIDVLINIGVPWYCYFGVLVITTFIALLSGYYPASKAAKLDAVEALRG